MQGDDTVSNRGLFESPADLEHFYRRISSLLGDGPVGIAGIDGNGMVHYWSRGCKGILGYDAAEVETGKKFAELSGEPLHLQAEFRRCLTEGHIMREGVFLHKDGSPRILHQIVLPAFIGRTEPRHAGYTVCLLDITEGKKTQEALRRERNMLRVVLDTMGAGLALFDPEERLSWANSTLSEWFGGKDGSLKGMLCSEVFRCRNQRCDVCALGRARTAGEVQSAEIERVDKAGRWRCFHQLATPLELGRRQYLVLTLDVTEERRRKEQLGIVNNLARALTRSLDPDRVQHLILTCVTAGHALGFNRAFLFLVNEENGMIEGSMAVGPASRQQAGRIWHEVSQQVSSLDDLLERDSLSDSDRELTRLIRSYRVGIHEKGSILARLACNMRTELTGSKGNDPDVEPELKSLLQLQEFIVSPLAAHGKAIGVILADNRFSGDPIREDQVRLLEEFAAQASLAIGNARIHRQLRDRMEELEKTQGRLLEAERLASVGRMAAHLAHEIRNPLTTVGGFAKSIRRSSGNPEIVRRNADIIYREALRLERVLDDALDFSRPVKLHKTRFQANDLLRDIADEYENVFAEKSIRLYINLEKNLPPLLADECQIRQVVINLLYNAFDALEGVEEKRLLIATSLTKENIVVSISDSGQGMDEDTVRDIFAPFYSTKKGGSGLGLSICRRIVVEHGGTITVESSLGKGSSFHLLFPK